MTTSARPMTDAFAQLDLFRVPASMVIVRPESRDLEWFAGKNINQGMSTSLCKVTDPASWTPLP
jgi:hypothetical protein